MLQPPDSKLKPTARNWIGAWWLAFVIGAIVMFIPVIPLLGFSKAFPNTEEVLRKKREFKDSIEKKSNLNYDWKFFIPAIKSLVQNKSYMFFSIAMALEIFAFSGLALFLPKLFETQFHLTTSEASLSSGYVILPG